MNKILLVGRIVRDPLVQSTQSGIKYARFTVAINRPFSTTNQTDFIPIVSWRNNADFVENFLDKGSLVSIEGYLTSSTYQSANNETVTRYEVSADRINSLETKKQADQRRALNEDNVVENLDSMEFENESPKDESKSNSDDDVPWDIDLN